MFYPANTLYIIVNIPTSKYEIRYKLIKNLKHFDSAYKNPTEENWGNYGESKNKI